MAACSRHEVLLRSQPSRGRIVGTSAPHVHRAPGEGLVARDEDRLVGARVRVPFEVRQGAADHRSARFMPAQGPEFEQAAAGEVEIPAQGQDLSQPMSVRIQAVVSVFVNRDLDRGREPLATGVLEGVHDVPELAAGLIDEAVHAVGGVQQQGDLHPIHPRRGRIHGCGAGGWFLGGNRGGEEERARGEGGGQRISEWGGSSHDPPTFGAFPHSVCKRRVKKPLALRAISPAAGRRRGPGRPAAPRAVARWSRGLPPLPRSGSANLPLRA